MRRDPTVIAIAVLVLLTSCASIESVPGPETAQAVAPSGKLRVAFLSTAATHAIVDQATGQLKGPAVDLGQEMARRLGVAFEPVPYTSFPPILAGATSDAWDVAMMGVSAEREQWVDFTPPYMFVSFSYLIPPGSSIRTVQDVDRAGVRIAVLEDSSPDAHLSRTLRNATLVRTGTLAGALDALRNGAADAAYATKATVLAQAERWPGSRALEDEGGEETAIAIPKGRPQAARYAARFVEAARSDGSIRVALEKSRLRGVVVAPPR
jgi:polar amino acid transport system substrate-binding protein